MDFGFVGASYTAPSIYQDAQECINFFPEIDPTKAPGSRGVVALYPTAGLVTKTQPHTGEVRALHTMSNGQWLVAVIDRYVYKIDVNFTASQIGTLGTSTGYVQITDNQTTDYGLAAYIVDGPNRYTWTVFNDGFDVLPLTDGPWTGASSCDVVDNYIIYNQPDTQNWAATDLGSLLSTTGYYGSKDSAPDNLVALIVDHRQVYLLGEVTSEVWVDVGNQITGIISFPFQRIAGTTMQHGCAAKGSIARFGESFAFVAKDTRGTATIGVMTGYAYQKISTHAVENTLVGKVISDAIAYTYRVEGHEFYVVTFPSIDLTWVYDLATEQWHKWLSFSNGSFHRHRSNCGAFFANQNIVGDYANGKIYSVQKEVYTEDGQQIKRVRRAPHLVNDFQREYFDELQIQFQPGVGTTGATDTSGGDLYIAPLQTFLIGPSEIVFIGGEHIVNSDITFNPQAMLRWSNDGGSTWSNEHWTAIGKQGKYKNRAIWRRLGMARDRIFEIAITDPVKAVIISANLKSSVGEN
ncbi:Bacteriophage P22, Gp10, DNA-stabilising [uncultured Caudovirales phage]|uniref:Bacteriophage P22, Gp10, DNA-stabilising n=1 Tax=uncultured Caudovirales phage TaxID=2100421 RepID=A0A6J5KN64_9CAUD|nr:Bacteriophage P22, Gp10, DNA-stabilising [uncultured Caudovirales phage]